MTNSVLYSGRKLVAQLIDPDKFSESTLDLTTRNAGEAGVDMFLAGGSITTTPVEILIKKIKKRTSIPVVLFPGNLVQLTTMADAVFMLSLISGRNAELLIGNHVIAAPFLKDIRDKVIPVGYILIDCGSRTSVEYMSQTSPIPYDKEDIAIATALAGEMLGMKAIYLEGGSGAEKPVKTSTIRAVKQEISIPLIAGGGLNSPRMIEDTFSAGADMIVTGNGCEKDPSLIIEACRIRDEFNKRVIRV